MNLHHYACGKVETFLQDFLGIRRTLCSFVTRSGQQILNKTKVDGLTFIPVSLIFLMHLAGVSVASIWNVYCVAPADDMLSIH